MAEAGEAGGDNNVTIGIDFDVKVVTPAPVAAAAATDDGENEEEAEEEIVPMEASADVELSDSTEVNGIAWSELKETATADGFKESEEYTDLSN